MITTKIQSVLHEGMVIPKPEAKRDFVEKGWGTRRGETALVYFIPNHKNPSRPYQKGVTIPEFEMAYSHLVATGTFSREWFNANMPACASEGGCNFTTIGGIFEKMGIAKYERGRYVAIE